MTARDRAILRDINAGKAELVCGCEPDLFIDGRCCCDQFTAHRLARGGFIAPVRAGAVGQRVPAVLTAVGRAELDGAP